MPTSASLFSGGKFADVGLMAAGFAPIWGVEMDPAIAEVADANLPGVTIRARVEDVDYRRLEPPDLLWASPECKEFSSAKTNGVEGPAQRAQADAICAALTALRPPLFVLENVVGYRRSPYSLPRICAALDALGYLYTLTNVNCADYGVPQTRRRLILRAARSLLPPLRGREQWVGWYAAIADLVPTLPASAFAPWQLARLEPLFGATLVHPTDQRSMPVRDGNEPVWTLTANSYGASHAPGPRPRAFLVPDQNAGQVWGQGYRPAPTPAYSLATGDGYKAFLVPGGNTELANPTSRPRDEGDPAFTVAGNDSATTNQRAWLVSGQSVEGGAPATRDSTEPSLTVGTNGDRSRAFIVDDQHGAQLRGAMRGEDGRGLTIRQAAAPVFTVQAGANKPARAWLDQGRVVAMTPRALARFQSIPDTYVLPEHRGLACRIVGNAVPPKLAQAVGLSLLGLLP